MAETAVTRNLSQIDAQLKELNASLKSCTVDSKSLDKSLKLDPTSLGLASARTSVLKDQIDLTQKKLEALRAKQAQYDAQTAAGVPVDADQYRKLTVQIAQAQSQLTVLTRQTQSLNTTSLETLKTQLSGVSKAASAILAAIVGIGVAFATEADSISDAASALNLDPETYQTWNNLFTKVTGSADAFSGAMNGVTQVLANISKGSTKNEAALQSLGLTIDDLKGKSPEEALQIIIEALSKVSDESERTVLATALLGDSGSEVAKVAGLTTSQISAMNSEFEQTGMLTNAQVASGKSLADTFKEIKQEFMVVAAELGTALMPTFQTFANVLKNLAPTLNAVANGISALGPAGQVAVIGSLAFLAVLPGLITGIVSLKKALDALSSNPVMLAVAAVVAGTAIGIGAAILTNGVSSTAASYSSTSSTTDNSTVVINVTSDSADTADETADKVAAAVVSAKKQRGQL